MIVNQNDVVMGHIDHSAYFDRSPLPSDEIELIGTGLMEAQGLSLIDSGLGTCDYSRRHGPKDCHTRDVLCRLPKGWKLWFYNVLWIE